MNHLKRLEIHHLLWLALGLALVGSLRHLAYIFGSVDGNGFAGWLQAIAVDCGLFALAYSLKARETRRRVVWLGIVMFTGISIYGNLAYGMLKMNEEGVLPEWIIWSKPYILAASLPVLVLYLAELVSESHQPASRLTKQVDDTEQVPVKVDKLTEQVDKPKRQPVFKPKTKQAAIERLLTFYRDNPDASLNDAGQVVNRSKTTVSNYLNELEQDGKIHRNGSGVQVLNGNGVKS